MGEGESIKSGSYCKCGSCGYIGYAYGILTSGGGSAPFCSKCGINNKLSIIHNDTISDSGISSWGGQGIDDDNYPKF